MNNIDVKSEYPKELVINSIYGKEVEPKRNYEAIIFSLTRLICSVLAELDRTKKVNIPGESDSDRTTRYTYQYHLDNRIKELRKHRESLEDMMSSSVSL